MLPLISAPIHHQTCRLPQAGGKAGRCFHDLTSMLHVLALRFARRLARRCALGAMLFVGVSRPGHAADLNLLNTERAISSPMAAAEVTAKSVLPPGFQLTVFAAEPDVRQPIAMATDSQGRLWVAENYSYPERSTGHPQFRDRIVVFEDLDNDGHFDRRTIFWEGAERLTSVEVGLGGVWALALPSLLFIPDANRDAVPDGPPQVMLDGFDYLNSRHNFANGLRWGPDGWLYGRQGILGYSRLGPPGTPDAQRTLMNAGIWRFHPTRRAVEVVASGTTNPWGMDWDEHGEGFFINTVIGHLWHVIPGAHYRRMFGEDPQPHVYDLIEQHADHLHWATNEVWTDVRKGVTSATLAAGGGHAHSGLLIYQGAQWPAAWNGKLLTVNYHGRRLNVERLERLGSGYVGRAEPDAMFFADPWFRGLDLLAAPDGSVFISDWSDTGECHDEEGVHRTSGRIYKLSYGRPEPRRIGDVSALGEDALADLQTSANDWLARQARRVLAERARRGLPLAHAHAALRELALHATNEVHRLRALWAWHVSGNIDPAVLRQALRGSESERAWALRLWEDERHDHPQLQVEFDQFVAGELAGFAAAERSALVRLSLASLLQKLTLRQRHVLADALLRHAEDDGDHNLPFLLWYGIEPLALTDPNFVELIAQAHLPRLQRLGARRLAEEIDQQPGLVNSLLLAALAAPAADSLRAILEGVADGLAGRRQVRPPAAWPQVDARVTKGGDADLRARARDLSALFGDGRAVDQIRAVALNNAADLPRRRSALQALIDARAPGLRALCEQLLSVRDLSATAARGLAIFEDPAVADRLIAEWPSLYGHERAPVLNALLTRPAFAGRLLEAIADGRMKRSDLSVFHARQIRQFGSAALSARLQAVWGEMQDLDETARASALERWRPRLSPEALGRADLQQGRATFQVTCAPCHRLHGEGGELGPDLTGAARDNLDYLLENILFPSAVVPAPYRQTTLTLRDGRVMSGVVSSRANHTLTLQSVGEKLVVDSSDIEQEETSSQSLMPEGLLESLDESRVRALIRFLMTKDPPPPGRQ